MEYINRTTNKLNETTKHIYAVPINYMNDDGGYEPIDLNFEDSKSTIGDISLNRKNCFSTGIRKDRNPNKFVGIRPDDCQDGSKQVEISVNEVEIDGVSGYDMDKFISAPSSHSLFQMYNNDGFKDFKVQFKLHLKGVSIENDKYEETIKIRNKLDTEFINLGQDTGINILNRYANDPNITSNDSYLRIYYGQITDEFFARFGYESKDEFGDSNLSSYTFYDIEGSGSSTYLKDSLVFYAVSKNINDFSNSVLINICNKYGLSLEGNLDDTGKYFFKNGKKVGGYASKENELLAYLNTKDIPKSIKDLYVNKDFNETSYLDLSVSQFDIDIKNQFNYDVDAIEVDTNYYQGSRFHIDANTCRYIIDLPKIFDKDFNEISYINDCTHTLKDNGDGTYLYTKYLSTDGLLKNLGNTENYIDVNITLNYFTGSGTGIATHAISAKNTTGGGTSQSKLDALRNLTTASAYSVGTVNNTCTATKSRSGNTISTNYNYSFLQYHMNFDTSGVSSATNVNLKMWGAFGGSLSGVGASYGTYSGIKIMGLKSTYVADSDGDGNLNALADVMASMNDFEGFTTDWDTDDVTEYFDSTYDLASSSTSYAWITKALNSTAVSDVGSLDVFKMCLIEALEYYEGNFDSSWTYTSGSESTTNGTASKGLLTPRTIGAWNNNTLDSSYYTYIEVTEGTSSTPTENSTFFGANF